MFWSQRDGAATADLTLRRRCGRHAGTADESKIVDEWSSPASGLARSPASCLAQAADGGPSAASAKHDAGVAEGVAGWLVVWLMMVIINYCWLLASDRPVLAFMCLWRLYLNVQRVKLFLEGIVGDEYLKYFSN